MVFLILLHMLFRGENNKKDEGYHRHDPIWVAAIDCWSIFARHFPSAWVFLIILWHSLRSRWSCHNQSRWAQYDNSWFGDRPVHPKWSWRRPASVEAIYRVENACLLQSIPGWLCLSISFIHRLASHTYSHGIIKQSCILPISSCTAHPLPTLSWSKPRLTISVSCPRRVNPDCHRRWCEVFGCQDETSNRTRPSNRYEIYGKVKRWGIPSFLERSEPPFSTRLVSWVPSLLFCQTHTSTHSFSRIWSPWWYSRTRMVFTTKAKNRSSLILSTVATAFSTMDLATTSSSFWNAFLCFLILEGFHAFCSTRRCVCRSASWSITSWTGTSKRRWDER